MALVGIEPVPSRTAAERTDRSTTDATIRAVLKPTVTPHVDAIFFRGNDHPHHLSAHCSLNYLSICLNVGQILHVVNP